MTILHPMLQAAYDWSVLDDEIGQAVTAGFKINITINNGSDKTPQWLLDALPAGQKIDLLDPPQITALFASQSRLLSIGIRFTIKRA